MRRDLAKGYLFAVVSAIIYGTMPLMAKHIYADGVNPLTLVFLRNLFSLVPLALLAYREKGSLRIPRAKLPAVMLISLLGCCVTPILLFSSYQFIASGTATVFHFIYPAIVVVTEIVFLKSKVRAGNLVSVLLAVAGIGLFYSPGQALSLSGSALALSSGLTFACYVILLSRFDDKRVSGFLFCFHVALISAVASLLICLVSGTLRLPATIVGWGLCLLFSLLVTTCAVSLFQRSARLIGSERTSILSTLEPITSLVIGVLIFGEPMGARTVLGSALVLSASLLIAVSDLKKSGSA